MKKTISLSIWGWIIASLFSQSALAQNGKVEKEETIVKEVSPSTNEKETQEIIIRKKGSKDTKVTLEINGGKILINGKPMAEFKEDGITINNRKMIIRDGNKITMDLNDDLMGNFDNLDNLDNFDSGDIQEITIDKLGSMNFNGSGEMTKTFLGVGTEKVEEGAKIMSVEKGSPAEKAGLKKDDIIYKIDDKKVDDGSKLSEVIGEMKVGQIVKVHFLRDGKRDNVTATLGERKNAFTMTRTFKYSSPNGKVRSLTIPRKMPRVRVFPQYDLGDKYGEFDFSDQNGSSVFINTRRPKLGLKIQDTEEGNGVKVLDVDSSSTSSKAGLMKDDVVTEIGGVKITNTDEAREQLRENKTKSMYTIKAKRNGKEMEFTIRIPKKLKTAEL
jgi:serine protease Do